MASTRCPALVDGKECGLTLVLIDQDPENRTATYECPLGHRSQLLLDEIKKTKCQVLDNGKPCSLPLAIAERDPETATEVYECPLGHRTYLPLEPDIDESR
jgi:hypothetical protein